MAVAVRVLVAVAVLVGVRVDVAVEVAVGVPFLVQLGNLNEAIRVRQPKLLVVG